MIRSTVRKMRQTGAKRHLAGLVVAVLLSAHSAQATDYEVMGTIDTVIEDRKVQLWVPYDRAEDDVGARRAGFGVAAIYTITATDGTVGEETSFPRLSLSFMRPGPNVVPLEMTYEPEFGTSYVADDETGDFSMTNVGVEGDLVRFEFSGTVVELDTATFQPAENGQSVEISGAGRITLLE